MTLNELRPVYVASLAQRSAQTARAYDSAIRAFLQLGNNADGEHIARFLTTLRGAPASRAQAISAVRAFLRFAMSNGVIPKCPIELLKRPTVAITSAARYLTVDELRALLESAHKLGTKHHATVLLLGITGLRRTECARAQWKHLYLDPQGTVGLTVTGKGGKTRVVAITPLLFALLAKLHGNDKLDSRDGTPLIHHHGHAYHPDGIWRIVRDAARGANLDKQVSPHWLRHTAATLAASNGISIYDLQNSMGHSRMETSARYLHVARGLKESVSNHVAAQLLNQESHRPRKPLTPWLNP